MERKKFKYNPKTLSYEEIQLTWRDRLIKIAGWSTAVIFTSMLLLMVSSSFISTPTEKKLSEELNKSKYTLEAISMDLTRLNKEIDQILKDLDQLFVNYSYNTSGQQMWTEKVAGVLFTKYLFRIGKAMYALVKDKPTQVLGQQGLEYITGANVIDPIDTLIDHTPLENLYNRWVLKDPGGQLMDLMAPNIAQPFDFFL